MAGTWYPRQTMYFIYPSNGVHGRNVVSKANNIIHLPLGAPYRPAPPPGRPTPWAGLPEDVYSLLDIPIAYGIDTRFYSAIKNGDR